jgi:YidC/Oxa1 family membrane protein insertase
MNSDNRNLISFAVLSALLIFAYQTFILGPQQKRARALHAHAEAAQLATPTGLIGPRLDRPAALAQSPRIVIDTPALTGSIALKGARLDDLFLKGYHVDLAKTSPLVELLRPEGMADAYFAEQGWFGANLPDLPTPRTLWTQTGGGVLSPNHPVTLSYRAASGLVFTRNLAVDAKSMFTVTDVVDNTGAAPVTLAPYVSIQRQDLPAGLGKSNIVHEGAVGILDPEKSVLRLASYKQWKKKGEIDWPSRGGWLGVTDKYWMTAFIPDQHEHIDAKVRLVPDQASHVDVYEATYSGQPRAVPAGGRVVEVSHVFTGAKVEPVLAAYKKSLGVPRFDDAIDWGHLFFITKPIYTLLEFFYRYVGNFGVAILMLTVVIRLITFPLANKGFEMGIKMKKIQPELQALQKKNKDDPQQQQKDMMALYAREKVNPITGCIPALLPIPIFYSLTKLFTVTIEMRQAPFFGWIHDLSARDPTTIVNLFGLIPWDPSFTPLVGGILGGMLHVGVWPLLYGVSMIVSMSMSPQQGSDPTQQMIMKFMPIVFTFIMAQYAVGLLIYWTWSSVITIVQQYVMMRRFKVENPIDSFFARFSSAKAT